MMLPCYVVCYVGDVRLLPRGYPSVCGQTCVVKVFGVFGVYGKVVTLRKSSRLAYSSAGILGGYLVCGFFYGSRVDIRQTEFGQDGMYLGGIVPVFPGCR